MFWCLNYHDALKITVLREDTNVYLYSEWPCTWMAVWSVPNGHPLFPTPGPIQAIGLAKQLIVSNPYPLIDGQVRSAHGKTGYNRAGQHGVPVVRQVRSTGRHDQHIESRHAGADMPKSSHAELQTPQRAVYLSSYLSYISRYTYYGHPPPTYLC